VQPAPRVQYRTWPHPVGDHISVDEGLTGIDDLDPSGYEFAQTLLQNPGVHGSEITTDPRILRGGERPKDIPSVGLVGRVSLFYDARSG